MSIIFGEGGATQDYAGVASAGQYWQSPSRNANTWYQNTQGHPIQIGVGLLRNSSVYVGSSTSNYVTVVTNGGDHSEEMNCPIVPVSYYFRFTSKRTYAEFY